MPSFVNIKTLDKITVLEIINKAFRDFETEKIGQYVLKKINETVARTSIDHKNLLKDAGTVLDFFFLTLARGRIFLLNILFICGFFYFYNKRN